MSASENKALIRGYLDAINGKPKPAAVLEQFIAEEDALLREHIAGYEAAFPRYTLVADDIIAEDYKVVLRLTFLGAYQGGVMDIPATGQQVAVPGVIIYRIAGGRIAEHWMQVDSAALMQQLGRVPA